MDARYILVQPTMDEVATVATQCGLSRAVASCRFAPMILLNLYGVCLLRLGKIYEALNVFNDLVFDPRTMQVAPDTPDLFRVNLATARFLARNPAGSLRILRGLRDRHSRLDSRLRDAIRAWDRTLPFWQRLAWRLGFPPKRPIPITFAPGELPAPHPGSESTPPRSGTPALLARRTETST